MNVSAAGFTSSSISRSVSSNTTTWGSTGLYAIVTADTEPPVLTFTTPTDGLVSDLAHQVVVGTVNDNRDPIPSVQLKLNGGADQDLPVVGGVFNAQVKLKPGANVLEVRTLDKAGNSGVAFVTVSFNSGMSGYVHAAGDAALRIPDATIELVDSTGAKTSAMSQEAGAYAVNLSNVPSDYLLVVKAAGFISRSETISVSDDARVTMNLELVPGEDVKPEPLRIGFTEPQDGSTVTTDAVTIYGSVAGFHLTSISINGATGDVFPEGAFGVTVPLAEGDNVLEAVALGPDGESITGKLRVTRSVSNLLLAVPSESASQEQARSSIIQGSCAAVGGLEMLGLLFALPLLRFRRRRG